MRSRLIIPALLLAALAAGSDALANPKCLELVKLTVQELTGVRPTFAHNTEMKVEVAATPIKNQCQSGSCWIYATVSNAENRILLKTGQTVDLSEQFMIGKSLRVKALDALGVPGQLVTPGGTHARADWVIQEFGAVPASAWAPPVPFEKSPNMERMLYFVNTRIAQYHVESAVEGLSKTAKASLLKDAQADVLEILDAYTGKMPEKFTYDGKEYTPREWRDAFVPKDDRLIVNLRPEQEELPESIRKRIKEQSPKAKVKKETTIAPDLHNYAVPLETIEKEIIAQLKRGESVPLSMEVVHPFIDDATGVMSFRQFNTPEGFVPPPREYRRGFDARGKARIRGNDHLVDVVGADYDEKTGRIVKLKIKNSWSEARGDHGYYYMYRDYLEHFLNGVSIRRPASP